MSSLLRVFKPDVAHFHAPSRHLTPSVFEPLVRANVPVVMTLHDFKPWCTNRILFAKGDLCERCRGGAHWHAAAVGCLAQPPVEPLHGLVECGVEVAGGARGADDGAPSDAGDLDVLAGISLARVALVD